MDKHVYNTGIIGNCAYIAHINKDTNIDWLCWPNFNSTFVFGGMLDKNKGGAFTILPDDSDYTSIQYYLENTNILCTVVTCRGGKYRIMDVAPRFIQYERPFRPLMLIRRVEVLEGNPRIKIKCVPVCDYGETKLQAYRGSSNIEFVGHEEKIRLTTDFPINYILEEQCFVLSDTKYLALTYGPPLEAPLVSTCRHFIDETVKYWRQWIKRSSIAAFAQDYVIRSALTLKIHQFEDTGAIIAASTTSLPEYPGSTRNWDYRYCWLRDTYYVITALNHIAHFEEMEDYFHFITDISFSNNNSTDFRYQPLYGITGEHQLPERILPLEGYLGNKPVRVGNQAFEHIQNDIYGQVLISLLPIYTDHRFVFHERKDSAHWISFVLDKIEKTVDEKDAGIWEFRNSQEIHCYTNLFQWAGCCAAIKMAKSIDNEALLQRAESLKQRAINNIESCYNEERKCYTAACGNNFLDASTLQLILMNYLDPTSDRAKDHLIALEKELHTPNGLFYRYVHADDFGKPQSTFLICAFWYVEALACVGRLDDAIKAFNNLMQYSNHLKLFSEDVDEKDGSQWGNFPQAYSHVGLMNAAYRIAMRMDKPIFCE